MQMKESLRKFIQEHQEDDPSELLLHASRYQDVDVITAVNQIKARRQIKRKLPSWYQDDRLFFPSILAAEQCSSEITALYKQRLVNADDWLCDLTGGLGVDTCCFAQKVGRVAYVEQEGMLCEAASHNFHLLGHDAIRIIHDDVLGLLAKNDKRIVGIDVCYVDPARRGADNKRMFAIEDCEPDVMKIITLLPKPCKVIVKLSPMLDISQVLSKIPDVSEVHVVSVKNECKELLFVTTGRLLNTSVAQQTDNHPIIHCANYTTDGTEQTFRFRLSDERAAIVAIAKHTGNYLYEPNASILKAGAYKSVANQFEVEKLHVSSHLYTSDRLLSSFPGRIFEIMEIIPFSSSIRKTLYESIPKANIAVRNFPLSVDVLRKRTQITDGGNIYLFATTLSDNQKVLIKCKRSVVK